MISKKNLKGTTQVFLFTIGTFTTKGPGDNARDLASQPAAGMCFTKRIRE